jgi:hypothetical protein
VNRYSVSIGLALLLSIALVLPVSAGDQRPVRGQFEGSGVEVAQRCPDALTIRFAINGVLSHLGRMTGGGTNCTQFTLGTESVPIWDGIAIVTAADGSTLTLAYEGQQGAPTNGSAPFSHSDTVVEGTGRFAGATGQLTIEGLIDFSRFPAVRVTGTVSGWINY